MSRQGQLMSKKAQSAGATVGGTRRKRSTPFLAAGAVLILAGALGFAYLGDPAR
jgi:hypothetical protein